MLLEGNAEVKVLQEHEMQDIRSGTVVNGSITLTEEEAIEFLSDANLVSTYALIDIDGFRLNSHNLSQRLGISKAEAETCIEKLQEMSLIQATEVQDKYLSPTLTFDDAFIASSDLLSLYMKFSQNSLGRITSKDIFSFRYQAMSKKVIQKYQPEIERILSQIASESLNESDCEIYATGFSFTKLTRTRREK